MPLEEVAVLQGLGVTAEAEAAAASSPYGYQPGMFQPSGEPMWRDPNNMMVAPNEKGPFSRYIYNLRAGDVKTYVATGMIAVGVLLVARRAMAAPKPLGRLTRTSKLRVSRRRRRR